MSNKILHIAGCDKFIPPFIEFVRSYFNFKEHTFLLTTGMAEKDLNQYQNVKLSKKTILSMINHHILIILKMHLNEKIILHGLSFRIVVILFFMPWLLKRCYWVMWGGDLYSYNIRTQGLNSYILELVRAFVIKRIGHFVTYIKGDYELAKEWYGVDGIYHECLMYPSNVYKEYAVPPKSGDTINILVGNSADPTNNHAEIFERVSLYKNENIHIYCPLSYGQVGYAELILKLGSELFGSKFTPLLDFMSFEKYLELLGQIDIAMFAHKRQQAMGNTITLLGLGKKVYMRKDVVQWNLFDSIGVKVFDVEQLNINLLSNEDIVMNITTIRNRFSETKLVEQYAQIFGN
ncbi:MAG: TDP-N-acetylfucosamine:lipid II N-acetylfucosaminyltransferase [Methylotenera sp.]|nr:TDP-N-acetylfucosamine:lipid II N-acetylfucosaminyltransferase [Methylotenera sp.]